MNKIRNGMLVSLIFLALSSCIKSGDIKEDTSSFEEASKVNFQLGVEYFRQGNLTLAYEKLKKSVTQDDSNSQAFAFLGLVSERLDLPADAETYYRRAVHLDNKDPAVQNMYGGFLCRTGKPEMAEQHFVNAAENRFYSTPEAALDNAGSCLMKVDKFEKAESYFRRALKLQPDYAMAIWHMAELYYGKAEYLQASSYLQRLGTADRLPPEALLLGYRIENGSGRFAKAAAYASELRKRYPESDEAAEISGLRSRSNGG